MSEGSGDGVWKTLVMTIVPMFFGSLLFAGVLESYKNDSAARKDIMEVYYKPVLESMGGCQKIGGDLVNKYGQMAGSFQLMLDEFQHVINADRVRVAKEYGILLESLISSHNGFVA